MQTLDRKRGLSYYNTELKDVLVKDKNEFDEEII